MVKIKQGSIWGRIGTGFGQGIAEQLPKEIERSRLSSGLKALSQKKDLSPFEMLSEAYGIPGVAQNPQLVQSITDFLRLQAAKEGFRRPGAQQEQAATGQPGQANQQPQMQPSGQIQGQPQGKETIPSDFASRHAQALSQPGIVRESGLGKEYLPGITWTPEQRNDDIYRIMERNPFFTYEQARELSADNERRALQAPEDYQKRLKYLQEKEDQASDQFDTQLSTLLQKSGENKFEDASGELQSKLKKAMYNDLATDSRLTPRTAAEKWANKALDFARVQNQLRTVADRSILDKIGPYKKEETLKNLKTAQKIYDDLGMKRQFKDLLRSHFSLTPSYAALVASPRSEPLKKIANNFKIDEKTFDQISTDSQRAAEEFGKNRNYKDSPLAFAREMKDRYPMFDMNSYFDYLRENLDSLNLSDEQKEEVLQGVPDILRSWGDYALFPLTGRSKAHD